jgi:hypothetical protein
MDGNIAPLASMRSPSNFVRPLDMPLARGGWISAPHEASMDGAHHQAAPRKLMMCNRNCPERSPDTKPLK